MNLTYLQESRECCQVFIFTHIHDFTSSNWLIIYSVTAGEIFLCVVFCKYRSCVFFLWTYRNMPAFCYSFSRGRSSMAFYSVWKGSILRGSEAISDSTWAKLKWHYPTYPFSPGKDFLSAESKSLASKNFFTQQPALKGRILAHWPNHKIHHKSAICIQKRNYGSHHSKLCSYRKRGFWWGYS